jgi:peptide/nickel transport system permease protein
LSQQAQFYTCENKTNKAEEIFIGNLRSYFFRRISEIIPVILSIIVINFILIQTAPGDPALALAGEWAELPEIENVRIKWGLDRPIHEQLLVYLSNIIRGDLGTSYHYQKPVINIILERFPLTLLLVLTSMILGIVLGTILGTFSASRFGRRIDHILSIASIALYSMPVFWVGFIFVITLALGLKLFPFAGFMSLSHLKGWDYVADVMWHMALPSITLMLALYIPVFVRISRASVVEVMNEDYITTVRAAGLKERAIFFRHALKNALVPVIQVAGMWLSSAFTGVIMTETVFSWPGMGMLMWSSLQQRDYPVLMGIFVISGVWVVVMLLITDLICAAIDPRIMYE